MLHAFRQRIVIALLALALASLGFAHDAAKADTLALEAAAVMLDAEICGESDITAHGSGCEACRLAAGADLPPLAVELPARVARRALWQMANITATNKAPGHPSARSPPA